MEALKNIQSKLKAPKNQNNSFGGYKYRSCEDILEAVKPLLAENNAELVLSDEIEVKGDRFYIKATATLKVGDETASATGWAREALSKKGMDESQITGTASSYARKYALNGLFLIDDSKDSDTDAYKRESDEAYYQQLVVKIEEFDAAGKLPQEQKANFEKLSKTTDKAKAIPYLEMMVTACENLARQSA